eukprot:4668239-Pleurochrysis_carterae.AAC.1
MGLARGSGSSAHSTQYTWNVVSWRRVFVNGGNGLDSGCPAAAAVHCYWVLGVLASHFSVFSITLRLGSASN